jgi:hypothetical protein
MQDFTMPGALSDLWIGERATDTIAAVLVLVADLVDVVAQRLLDTWQRAEASASDYPAPTTAWALAPEPGPSFEGITGATSTFRQGGDLQHQQFARRRDLAERVLRETRTSATKL